MRAKLRTIKIKYTIGYLVILAGICVFCYSTVATMWNEYLAGKLVNKYSEIVAVMDEANYEAELARAREYNATKVQGDHLVSGTQHAKDPEYEALLNLEGDGMMGYVDIPKIAITTPIYHYTDDKQLASGIGHLHGSSLPIGGEGTNSILTGHTGLPSNMLFTRLDEMKIGDQFYLHVLNLDMAYEITGIEVVLPAEVDHIRTAKGKDRVTLITCTPYGVNSHRLIITGERTEYPAEEEQISQLQVTATKVVSRWKLYVGVIAFFILTTIVVNRYEYEKNRIRYLCGDWDLTSEPSDDHQSDRPEEE